MRPTIRGSDVFVKEDLRAILDALDIAARHQHSGCWREGWLSATSAMRTAIGIDAEQPEIVTVHEVMEYRHERIEHYAQPPAPPAERQFKIVGQREEPAQIARQAPRDMTGDDVNVTVFNSQRGRLSARQEGFVWVGDDGYTAFWDAADWQRVDPDEFRRWGEVLPDDWQVLCRHLFAEGKRRLLGQSVRMVDNRRLLR